MTKKLTLTLLSTVALAGAALAGETTVVRTSKEVVAPPPPPPPVYGTGFYVGLQAGANVYQDFGGEHRFSFGGSDVEIERRDKVGFAGGLKLGYVFGTGTVRPTIEGDFYYNGVKGDVDAQINGTDADFNGEGDFHTGAFMGNFLLRFAFDRFQPYLGGGVGGYVAESEDVEVTIAGRDFELDGGSDSGFAWQLIAGADYYFTEKLSAFFEYKFLNYEDAGFDEDRVRQHLLMLGLRVHF